VGGPENVTDSMLPQVVAGFLVLIIITEHQYKVVALHPRLPGQRYTTYCDPRLNYAQSLEVAFLLANKVGNQKKFRRGDSTATNASEPGVFSVHTG
jgi:hypothetical protein